MSDPVLLITGATGFVGGALLERLLAARPERRAVALVRRADGLGALARHRRVTALPGDLTREGLGLDRAARQRLERSVTEIVHCAADTRFSLAIERARAVNTEGTRRVLDLARRCRRLDRLAHVSTAYVCGRAEGIIPEAPLATPAQGFCNTYQQSKHEAEALVVAAMAEVPAAIYRISSIAGDSRTGRVAQWNHVHHLIRLFPRNVLPIMPAAPEAPVDLVPDDWVAAALAHLVDRAFAPGGVAHLCAGPAASLTVRELVDLTRQAYEGHPLGRRFAPIRVPAFVPLDEFERYAARHRRSPDRLLAELLRALGYFLPHLGLAQPFDTRRAAAALAGAGLRLPPVRDYYARVVGACLEAAGGSAASRAVAS